MSEAETTARPFRHKSVDKGTASEVVCIAMEASLKKVIVLGVSIASAVVGVSLVVPMSALAQDNTNCPVAVRASDGLFGSYLKVKNTSPQPIDDVIFRVAVLNAVGEPVIPDPDQEAIYAASERPEQTFGKELQPGQEGSMANNMRVYMKPDKGLKIVYYARAVRFKDGSIWKDDGNRTCGAHYGR